MVFIESTCVHQLEFGIVFAATAVLFHEPGIGKLALWILIEKLHVRVGGRGVEIEVILLYILTMIAFSSSESEQTLLQNRILAVPQGQGKADQLMTIANAAQAVLTPAISSRARVVMRNIIPGGATGAVVFPHCAPLPLAQVRTPPLPVHRALPRFLQPLFFFGEGSFVVLAVLLKPRHFSSHPSHYHAATLTALAAAGAPAMAPKIAP